MLRTKVVRRAGRLLGAVTATGVLSLGLLAAAPMAAQACPVSGVSSTYANGIGQPQNHILLAQDSDANGI